jgi:hypothetical protein
METSLNKAKTFTASEKREHRSTVGRIGTVDTEGISVAVKVVAERFRYGRLDLKVKPLAGSGTRWVEYHNVRLSKRKKTAQP